MFKLPYVEIGTSLARTLNTGQQDESLNKEQHLLEIFCDSDWAGSVGRKSTTACVIFLDSVLVTSFSRTQKSIALSSCESEVLALTAGCSEGILLRSIWEFLSQKQCKVIARVLCDFHMLFCDVSCSACHFGSRVQCSASHPTCER